MSTHNMCFCEEIRKLSVLFVLKSALSVAMYHHTGMVLLQLHASLIIFRFPSVTHGVSMFIHPGA